MPVPAAVAVPPAPRRRRGRWLTVLLAVLGLVALAGGGVGVGAELTRPATEAEIETAAKKEEALRWRFLKAGEIFPAKIDHQGGEARRVGIARDTGCPEAMDEKFAEVFAEGGCTALVRATYTVSGTHAITIGAAVFRNEEAAAAAGEEVKSKKALRVAAFADTVVERFGDDQRQVSGSRTTGPYVVLWTAGFTDGRKSGKSIEMAAAQDTLDRVRREVTGALSERIDACKSGRIEC